jgi:endonuclease/exonuclease/phosphatase family metal-dependent hydrolase
VRILTWNVWGRNGAWEERQAAITRVLAAEAPDVVCLQEVWIDDDGTTLADRLAADLDLHHVDADRHRVGSTIGNAVLARWPISASTTLWLPRQDGGVPYRTLLAARVEAPNGPIPVHCTHLDWQYDASAARVVQARAIARYVAAHRGDPASAHPPVVAGDLNAVPDADEIRLLTGRTAVPVAGLVFQDAWEVAAGTRTVRRQRGPSAGSTTSWSAGPGPAHSAILFPAASLARTPSMASSRRITTLSSPIWSDASVQEAPWYR